MSEDELSQWQNLVQSKRRGPSPVMFIDPQVAVKNAKTLNSLLPKVEIFYAIKSLSETSLIEALKNEVTGFDVASWGEIQKLKKLGISSNRLLFSNPVKIPAHVKAAYKEGVRNFAFDSVEEIHKLAKYAPGSSVYLRIRVSDSGSKFPLSKKFGADPLHATAYVATAIDNGLDFVGIAFHVGSQSETSATWLNALEVAGNTIHALGKVGIKVKLLNIGGGFPANYTEPVIPIAELAGVIKSGLAKYIPKDIRLVAEPGRFISADAAVMVATVIGKEYRSGSHWLYLDVGAFQGLIEPLEIPSFKYPIMNLDSKDPVSSATFVLTGPTCDAQDTLGLDYLLPSNTTVGDRLLIGAVGAYSIAYASNFNGFGPPKVVCL